MGLYTQTVTNLHRAPYREQVLVHLIRMGCGDKLTEAEEAKIRRVSKFLPAQDCAREIDEGRGR